MAYYIWRGIARHFSECLSVSGLLTFALFHQQGTTVFWTRTCLSVRSVYLTHNCTFSSDVESIDLTGTSSLSSRKQLVLASLWKEWMHLFFTRGLDCSLLFPDKNFGHQYCYASDKVISPFLVYFWLCQNLADLECGIYLFAGTHFSGIFLLSINSFSIFSISLKKFCLKDRRSDVLWLALRGV